MRFSRHASAVNDTMQQCTPSCAVSTRECSCQRPTQMRSSVLHIRGARCENRHLAHHDASPASGSSVLSIGIMLTAVVASYASLNFEACMIRCERKRQKLILLFTFGAVRGPPPHLFASTPRRQQKYVFLRLGKVASPLPLTVHAPSRKQESTARDQKSSSTTQALVSTVCCGPPLCPRAAPVGVVTVVSRICLCATTELRGPLFHTM